MYITDSKTRVCKSTTRTRYVHGRLDIDAQTLMMISNGSLDGIAILLRLDHLPSFPPVHLPFAHIILVVILRRILDDPLPKRDVNPPFCILSFWDRMLPIMLRPTPHNDHVPVCQEKLFHGSLVVSVVYMTEEEVARCTEREGGYTWFRAEERFRVGMVRYRVSAGRIVVDESKVIGFARHLFD